MARYLFYHRRRRNPEVFGEDVVDLGVKAVGLAFSALVNDQLIAPFAKGITSSFGATGAKIADAATTGISAWALGKIGDVIDDRVGENIQHGGMILAAGRLISAFIPGFQISAQVPVSVGPFFQSVAVQSGQPAVPSGSSQAPALPAGGRYPPSPNYGSVSPMYAAGL